MPERGPPSGSAERERPQVRTQAPTPGLTCLLVSPLDPISGRLRTGPAQRLKYPPPGVRYTVATDRVSIPTSTGEYKFSPVNVGLTALKFAVEHAFPLDQKGKSIIHTFFWDVRKLVRPWFHESDQSFGQFLSGYNNVGRFVKRWVLEGSSSYWNSRGCYGVITWSNWSKRGFVEDGVDQAKVSVIPPPFHVREETTPHAGCNVLFVGRDYHRKGGDVVLRAFRALGDMGCRLVYVGKVEGKSAREAISSDPRIKHMERPSSRTLMEEVWPTIDVLALPTRADAFATTLVEAMARGIPVVSSRVQAIPEMVEDGVSGLLSDPGDEAGFLEDLGKLVESPEERRRMGGKAKERATSLFSPEKVNRSLMEVYLRAA